MIRRALLAAVLALGLSACSISEFQYVAGLTYAVIDYKLHDNGVR